MNTSLTNTYTIGHLPIEVKFTSQVVSLDFTPYVDEKDLKLLYEGSEGLVKSIKVDYKSSFQNDLKISNDSFIAEIWGHLVAYRIALWIKKTFKISPLQKLAKFAAFRSGLADCGEAEVDTNRWFWDALATVFFRKYK